MRFTRNFRTVWRNRYYRIVIKRKHIIFLVVSFAILLAIFAFLTNPYNRLTIVKNPYNTYLVTERTLELEKEYEITAKQDRISKSLCWMKKGVHISANTVLPNRVTSKTNENGIINELYNLRFDSNKPYIIAGDHFSMLYVRNLGVFYYPALDPRTAVYEQDWLERQKLLLKTTALSLDIFSQTGDVTTTIVPFSAQSYCAIDVFSYPSDTLYSLLYALYTMSRDYYKDEIHFLPSDHGTIFELYTKPAAFKLLAEYENDLASLLQTYENKIIDPTTGLVRKDLHLSGTKDITIRESAFYDNVIYWRTLDLAMKLGVIETDLPQLKQLKETIVTTFWNESDGYFLEDLSEESLTHGQYSSDWLVVLFTDFLDPKIPQERIYYERAISYIQDNEIDEPFGLRYDNVNDRHRLHFFPRLLLPSYGGSAIWSNWGMDYIRALLMLYKETGDKEYVQEAKKQLDSYHDNILKYRGFPEVYNSKGNLLKNPFYESMRNTGWVVNYVQVRELYKEIQKKNQTNLQ